MEIPTSGYFKSGVPYNRFGHGPGQLVVFMGMQFENRPLRGPSVWFVRNLYKPLETDHTIHLAMRRPGLSTGYSLRDMSEDYAVMIREEFEPPVDVIGLSTGGLIAQYLAVDHPDLVRRLVLHSTAHRLAEEAIDLQLRVERLVRENRWTAAYASVFEFMSPRGGWTGSVARVFAWLSAPFGGLLLGKPENPSDLLVTYRASNEHAFKDRLGEIEAHTLVVAGDNDPFYTAASLRETAEGIPNAELILYRGVGHPASGARFAKDVLSFLKKTSNRS